MVTRCVEETDTAKSNEVRKNIARIQTVIAKKQKAD